MSVDPGPRPVPRVLGLPGGLTLRPWTDADVPALTAAVNANLGHLRPFLPWAREAVSEQSQREFVAAAAAAWVEGREWVFGILRGAAPIGAIGLHTRRGPGVLEIGYWLAADEQGKGIVTQAAAALVEVAFAAGAAQVDICCDEANVRSSAVPRRLGFTLVDVETRPVEAPGETGRHQVWSLRAGAVA